MSNTTLVWSYTVYAVSFLAITVGGAGYVVFFMGQSPWWMLAAVGLCGVSFRPWHWRTIVTGKSPYNSKQERTHD